MMKLLAVATALSAAVAGSASGQSRFTVEQLVGKESIGGVRISPDSRWIAVERRRPYDQAPSYRAATMTDWLLSELEVHDAAVDRAVVRLSSEAGDEGYVAGPFAPDGTRMVVFRATARTLRIGVLTLASGQVHWLSDTPDWRPSGRTVAWRSPTELVFISRPDGQLPIGMRVGHQAQDRITALWAVAAEGRGSSGVYIPSGALRDTRRQAEPATLTTFDVLTGVQRRLARGEFIDMTVSSDGRHAALLSEQEDIQPLPGGSVRVGDPIRRRRLLVVDLETGVEADPLPREDVAMYLLSWSPDATRLLIFSRPHGEEFDTHGRFWVVGPGRDPSALDLDGTPWVERPWDGIPIPLGGWDGPHPVVQVRRGDGTRAWFRAGPEPMHWPVREGGERLLNVLGRTLIRRSDGLHSPDGDQRLLEPGRLIDSGEVGDGGAPQVWNPSGLEAGRSIVLDGSCTAGSVETRVCAHLEPGERVVAAAPNGRFLVSRGLDEEGRTAIRLHHRDGAASIAEANTGWRDVDWGRVVPIAHTDEHDRRLTSWLLLPPAAEEGPPPPVVVQVYPGANPGSPPMSFSPGSAQLQNNPMVISAAGYAVLAVALPIDPNGPHPSVGLAEKILTVVDEAGRQGLVDTDRIALIGHSFGGYGVLVAATQSRRFKAIIASNGYADLSRSMELPPFFRTAPDEGVPVGQMVGWGETGQGASGPFSVDPQSYVERSPLYRAATITAPALLIESDLDTPRMASLFSVLYRSNHEAGLLTYYGEGHTYSSPGNIRDLHARILEWLSRHLGPPSGRDPVAPRSDPGFEDRPK